jgi:hypothetical protein
MKGWALFLLAHDEEGHPSRVLFSFSRHPRPVSRGSLVSSIGHRHAAANAAPLHRSANEGTARLYRLL